MSLRLLFVILIMVVIAKKLKCENLTLCFVWEDDSYFSTMNRSAAAVYLGVQNANAYILPRDIQFRIVHVSTGPSCGRTMYTLVSTMYDLLKQGTRCDAFLGPSCAFTAAALYGFADTLNVPIFGAPAAGVWAIQVDADYSDYPLLTRPAFGFSDLTDFLLYFLDEFNYRHLTILQDDSYSFFSSMVGPIMTLLESRRRIIYQNTIVNYVRSKNMTPDDYLPTLRAANARSRVIFLMVHATGIRDIMIAASKMGYTKGEHVFLAVQLYDLPYWGTITPIVHDQYDSIVQQAYRSLLKVELQMDIDTTITYNFERQIKTIARDRYNYLYDPLESIDPVVKSLYETIRMYATAIKQLKETGQNYRDGRFLSTFLLEKEFQVFGEPFWIGPDGERDGIFDIQYFNAKPTYSR
ncbi:atrial natriuretic peptide receptor 1-like [Paramacrobiotus metropolitanus]|uniref:atrial natriuretic peptide receptor 1-like n=1 Tax=Paramacrobiotus metropolitanus TaxID=2943436 RepID=UPI002445F372|nr:atrial natriuretic peptide receptor 1-like [Paramacrobiotus metropolitanus]